MTLLSRALWHSTVDTDAALFADQALELIAPWIWDDGTPSLADGSYTRDLLRNVAGKTVAGTRSVSIRRTHEPAGLHVQVDDH